MIKQAIERVVDPTGPDIGRGGEGEGEPWHRMPPPASPHQEGQQEGDWHRAVVGKEGVPEPAEMPRDRSR